MILLRKQTYLISFSPQNPLFQILMISHLFLKKITTNDAFEHIVTSCYEIGPIIKSMKSASKSPCGLPSTFIKICHEQSGSVITKHIADLLNKVFSTGIFPQMWKMAHVTPIHKSGNKSDKANYRPISILSTLSKITESVIHRRFLRHLLSNQIITKMQAAYIPADSTAQQLIHLIHSIKTSMASKNIAHAVFLDVSKAFDAVWHQGLLAKLEQINVCGNALKLFSSYLNNRQSVTVVDGQKSAPLPLKAGVPQGSCLGPLLFILFINDLVVNLESTPYLYADDCTLLARGGCTFETTNILNRDLLKITKWALSSKVTFNPSKSKDLIFSNKLLPSHPTIFGLHCIERVTTVKHLGVFLTSTLDWNKQIQSIVKKVNYKLSIIHSVKGLSRQCLDVLYKLHIRSSIDYSLIAFGPSLNDSQLKILDNLNYRAARLVSGAQKYTSCEKLLKDLAWEDTRARIKYLCLCQLYKIMSHMTTPLVHECLPPLLNHRYPTNRTFEHYPFMSNFFVNSFFPYSIKQWDQLDPELRKEHDFAVFKAKLKETIKPSKFKHFNVGYKYPNQLHTQLRVGRSSLNSHLYPIGLSNTKSCPCGFANESVEHFLLAHLTYENHWGKGRSKKNTFSFFGTP